MHKSRRPNWGNSVLADSSFRKDEEQPCQHVKFVLWRRNNLVLVLDGRNRKKNANPFQTAPRYLFRASNAKQQDSPPGPLSLQWTEMMWKASFPICFLAWWCLLPQTCIQRLGQQSRRRTINYLTHRKGFYMGSTPHVSEEPKHSLKLAETAINTPKTTQRKPIKSILWEKRERPGGGSTMIFHSDLMNKESICVGKKSLSSLDNPISRCRCIHTQPVSGYTKPALTISLGCK